MTMQTTTINTAKNQEQSSTLQSNPVGLAGIEFVEFASPDPESLHKLFVEFGFSLVATHKHKPIDLYVQNQIHFLLNKTQGSLAETFSKSHGPSICSMGWKVNQSPENALKTAVTRGAKEAKGDYEINHNKVPAVSGIGNSLIYFVEQKRSQDFYQDLGFVKLPNAKQVPDKGFICIDHLTNNVERGTMKQWGEFYQKVFGFTEVRYFDIRGVKTGLQSYALRSPCGSFCIPINEGTESKSQINEYLEEYRGPGIQHLAFLTEDILSSLRSLEKSSVISFLDIDADYYQHVFERVPNVTEDKEEIQRLNVLVDGDPQGYLLQIFTKNLVGPIFVEIIQRKNHQSFGEGNFGALFRSIERDQIKRGYLNG